MIVDSTPLGDNKLGRGAQKGPRMETSDWMENERYYQFLDSVSSRRDQDEDQEDRRTRRDDGRERYADWRLISPCVRWRGRSQPTLPEMIFQAGEMLHHHHTVSAVAVGVKCEM